MLKFIHAADIHIDSPMHRLETYDGAPVNEFRQAVRRAFENLVQLGISEKIDFLLIAGDLYDGDWKDYNTGLYLVAQMSRLNEAGIPVFIIAGNHDAASRITRTLRFPANVRFFPADQSSTFRLDHLHVAVHGQSFVSPVVKKDLSGGYPDPVNGYFNIGLLHTCANGREGHEPYAPCSPNVLRNKGYDYWALGHIHKYEVLSEAPPIVFPGNIQGRHIRETGTKGCVMITVDEAGRIEPEFTPLDVVRWAVAEVDASGVDNAYEVIDRIRMGLEERLEKNEGMPLAVRVIIHGETAANDELLADTERWAAEIRSAAIDAGLGRIWVEKIRFDTEPVSDGHSLTRSGALGELLGLFEELIDDPTLRRELVAEMDLLDKKLPRDIKEGAEGLHFNDPQWSVELLTKVKPMLIRRLLSKESGQ